MKTISDITTLQGCSDYIGRMCSRAISTCSVLFFHFGIFMLSDLLVATWNFIPSKGREGRGPSDLGPRSQQCSQVRCGLVDLGTAFRSRLSVNLPVYLNGVATMGHLGLFLLEV